MVRIGDVESPLVACGTADAIISTEPVEALRYIKYANKNTFVVTDSNIVVPFTVTVGGESYPPIQEIYKEIRSHAKLTVIDASGIAKKAGAVIAKNIVLLGSLAATGILPFESEVLLDTILKNVPAKYRLVNENAFRGGMQAFREK